jgi:hypothetical protein
MNATTNAHHDAPFAPVAQHDLLRALFSNAPPRVAGLELEASALRRAIGGAEALRAVFGPSRSLAGYWVALEVTVAKLHGEAIGQKQLTAMARGVWSQATISGAIRDLVAAGFIKALVNPQDRRSPTLTTCGDLQEAFCMRGEATHRLLREEHGDREAN